MHGPPNISRSEGGHRVFWGKGLRKVKTKSRIDNYVVRGTMSRPFHWPFKFLLVRLYNRPIVTEPISIDTIELSSDDVTKIYL